MQPAMAPQTRARGWNWLQAWPYTLAFFLLACSTATFVIQQYNGPPLAAERIAILRIQGGGDEVLASLDGEGLGFHLQDPRDRIHVEMLPGRHEVSLGVQSQERTVTRAFEAQAGRMYRAVVVRNRLQRNALGKQDWSVGVFEIDPDTNELLVEVSQDLLPPPPLVIPPPAVPTPAAPSTSGAPTTPGPAPSASALSPLDSSTASPSSLAPPASAAPASAPAAASTTAPGLSPAPTASTVPTTSTVPTASTAPRFSAAPTGSPAPLFSAAPKASPAPPGSAAPAPSTAAPSTPAPPRKVEGAQP